MKENTEVWPSEDQNPGPLAEGGMLKKGGSVHDCYSSLGGQALWVQSVPSENSSSRGNRSGVQRARYISHLVQAMYRIWGKDVS